MVDGTAKQGKERWCVSIVAQQLTTVVKEDIDLPEGIEEQVDELMNGLSDKVA